MGKKKLVRVELVYDNGARDVLSGEAAEQWEQGCRAVGAAAAMRGVRMPALPWKFIPARPADAELPRLRSVRALLQTAPQDRIPAIVKDGALLDGALAEATHAHRRAEDLGRLLNHEDVRHTAEQSWGSYFIASVLGRSKG